VIPASYRVGHERLPRRGLVYWYEVVRTGPECDEAEVLERSTGYTTRQDAIDAALDTIKEMQQQLEE
jgi:hypothetical protein